MKIKTAELTGPALDWAVAEAEGNVRLQYDSREGLVISNILGWIPYRPSVAWQQGGPIIEREGLTIIRRCDDFETDAEGCCAGGRIPVWAATSGGHPIEEDLGGGVVWLDDLHHGPTPLIAAMRLFVTSKLGDEVDVPEELLCTP